MPHQDTFIGRLTRLRERFKLPSKEAPWLGEPRRILRFLVLAVKKARADDLNVQSASLAFITVLSLIPLLTSFSVIGARAFNNQQEEQRRVMLDLLSQLLPYSEEALLGWLETFLKNAGTISGFGFLIFLVTVLFAFSTIEHTINSIWNVPRLRPFRSRLQSFSLLIVCGPLVIALTYSGLLRLLDVPAFQSFADSLPAQFIPFAVTLLGLTALYWLVPYATVHFRSALGGGLTAALVLEALRQGFGLYIDKARAVPMIYGSLGLAFFFMISIFCAWWIILLGSEVTYCVEHYAILLRERLRAAAPEGSWLGIVALVVLTDRFRSGTPITPHELLADRLRLRAAELRDVVDPLLRGGLVRETGGDAEGFLLACDPYELRLGEVFELYEPSHRKVLDALPDELVGQLEKLRVRLTDARRRQAGDTVLADLLASEAPPSP